MKTYIITSITVTFLFLLITPVSAGEIQYGQVEDVYGSEIHIQYKGPGGEQNFVCEVVSDRCESFGTSTPSLFPEIDGESEYQKGPNGRYAVTTTTLVPEDGDATYIYTVYDISNDEVQIVGFVPYFKDVSSIRFPWSGGQAMLFGTDGEIVTYDIEERTLEKISPDQSEFPIRSLSPSAGYLSSYNFVDEVHRIWDTATGELIEIPSETADFVEFSQDERLAVFVDDDNGYQTLHRADLSSVEDGEVGVERVFEENFTVEDYLFYKNDLYAVGNTAEDPYDWVLYRYDPEEGSKEIIARNVSYASYIRPVGEHGLSFLQIEGKNTNVALYDPETDTTQVISPVEPSPASDTIERSTVSFDTAHGVLYEPTRPRRDAELFVWLHGGPKRQTSVGYHSYLSYAVYDELLERLAESGAYVLKLDYTGSFGHGNEFMSGLTNELGVADVQDVKEAAADIQDRFDIETTYLIGNSYGGYLGPKALVEAPDQFDGAVAINGVFDWFTLLERIPSSPFRTYFNGLVDLDDLEENYEMYREASVYKRLSDLDDQKMLLIYGEDDGTVPTWQTREFFYLAESLDTDVSLLKLEEEGHIIRERESLDELCRFIVDGLSLDRVECR